MNLTTKALIVAAGLVTGLALAEASPLTSPIMLRSAEIRATLEDTSVQYRMATERFCATGEWYANGDRAISRGRYEIAADQICITEIGGRPTQNPMCRRVYRNNSHYYLGQAGAGEPEQESLELIRIRRLTPPSDCR
jgi:hypothetical protein